jgi:hypothetical protein
LKEFPDLAENLFDASAESAKEKYLTYKQMADTTPLYISEKAGAAKAEPESEKTDGEKPGNEEK